MPEIRIFTDNALGPLTIEALGPRGERTGEPLTLSSSRRSGVITVAALGDYTVVATRPSGEQLLATASVSDDGGEARIDKAGPSPSEFLRDAARLGLTYEPRSAPGSDPGSASFASPGNASTAARAMTALIGEQPPAAADGLERAVRATRYRLVSWRYGAGGWQIAPPPRVKVLGDYLQVAPQDEAPAAFGLLKPNGFGPIVIVPPFRRGIEVSFFAQGVAMDGAADRTSNPSAVRVPVALAVPQDAGLADLLVGVNAAVLPNATAILDQVRAGDPRLIRDVDHGDVPDPAAAVLAALFMARFVPSRLSLPWLRELNAILPDVADSWTLLAWARMIRGDDGFRWDLSIAEMLRTATRCRCTYFARARSRLGQLVLRYGPFPRARRDASEATRQARPGDFLDFAAEAGGLDAFWGRSPTRPGPGRAQAPRGGVEVSMRAGVFRTNPLA